MKRPSQIPISDRDWQRTPSAVQGLVVSSLERIGQHEQIVEQLTARVASLEEELARRKGRSRRGAQGGSSGSSASASSRSDASGRRRSSGRSPGGQPGHEGHGRSWVSVDEVDELIPVKPSTCPGCGQPLAGDDPHPQRHQEVVIPPVRAQVIEYQLHTLRCAHCACLTVADWPEDVSRHTYGPSVQAWVGLLAGAYRMSKRNIQSLLSEAFGVEVSLGTVSRLEQEVSSALAGAVEEGAGAGQPGGGRLRSLFGLRASAAATPASLLGSPAAHLRGVRGPGWRSRLHRSTVVGRQRAIVYLVAPGPRRHPETVQLPGLCK